MQGRVPFPPAPGPSGGADSWDLAALASGPDDGTQGSVPSASVRLAAGARLALRPGLEVVVRELLGEGGMGVVYLVFDPRLRRHAALKTVRPAPGNEQRAARFQREVVVTAHLDHPGIPAVYEAGRAPSGEEWLLMRYLPGRTLAERLREVHAEPSPGARAGRLPPLAALRPLLGTVARVAEAVACAHDRGVVHRDLKPSNVVLGAFGEVCVADWGLARDLRESPSDDAAARRRLVAPTGDLTQDGAIVGTVGWMSPEQARGEEVGPPADVFSLGALLSAVLTGRPPFEGATYVEIVTQTGMGEVCLPRARRPDLDPELAAVVARALAPDPLDRYPTAAGLARDLEAWLEGRPVDAFAYGPRTRLLHLARRRPGLVAGLAAASVAGALGLGAAVGVRERTTAALQARAVDAARAAALAAAREAEVGVGASPGPRAGAPGPGADAPGGGPGGGGAADEARAALQAEALARSLARWAAARRWHDLDPTDGGAAAARVEACLALARVAVAQEQWSLARRAAAEAAEVAATPAAATAGEARAGAAPGALREAARAAEAAVDEAAAAAARERAAEVAAWLARADAGGLDAPGAFDDALFALTRRAHPATAAQLAASLREVTATLAAAERAVWREVATPLPWERGQAPIDGLDAAAARALGLEPGGALPGDARLLEAGRARLVARLAAARGEPVAPGAEERLVRDHLATEQAEAVGRARLGRAALCCAALGRLGVRAGPAVDALTAHLAAARDPAHAARAAVALARLGGRAAHAAVEAALERPAGGDVLRQAVGPLRRGLAASALAELEAEGARAGAGSGDLARARLLALAGRPGEAIRALEGALAPGQPGRGDPAAWVVLADARAAAGDVAAAVAALSEALRARPDHVDALARRGDLLRQVGRWADAEADYGGALRLAPGRAAVWLHRGAVRYKLGRLDDAAGDFARAAALEPALAPAWSNHGLCRLERGDAEGALPLLARAIELEPSLAEHRRLRAKARERTGDLAGALEDYLLAVDLAPRDVGTWTDLGLLRLRRDEPALALLAFDRAAALIAPTDPNQGVAHLNRAQALRRLGRAAEASEELDRAVVAAPALVEARLARVSMRADAGDLRGALLDLDAALEREPEHRIARFNRASVRRRLGDPRGALEDLLRLVAQDPDWSHGSADPWFEVAGLQLSLDGPGTGAEAALASASRAVARAPRDMARRGLQGIVLWCLGRDDDARAPLAEAAVARADVAAWAAALVGDRRHLARHAGGGSWEAALARLHAGALPGDALLAQARGAGDAAAARARERSARAHLGLLALRAGDAPAAREHLEAARALEDPRFPSIEAAVAAAALRRLGP